MHYDQIICTTGHFWMKVLELTNIFSCKPEERIPRTSRLVPDIILMLIDLKNKQHVYIRIFVPLYYSINNIYTFLLADTPTLKYLFLDTKKS